jgi:outer membrane beta-barrel protein
MTSEVQAAIVDLVEGRPLDPERVARALGEIMDGCSSEARTAALLVAMRLRGETVPQLIAAAKTLRARAVTARVRDPRVVDTCGTGGDGLGMVNVSTLGAIVAAGAGAVVAKHGNRAVSSKAGSADVLEALGVVIDAAPAAVEACLARAGIGFAFAPVFHAATRHAAGPRRELGTRTLFNLLGPLTNPARVAHQVVGVRLRGRAVRRRARVTGGAAAAEAARGGGRGSPRRHPVRPARPGDLPDQRRRGSRSRDGSRPARPPTQGDRSTHSCNHRMAPRSCELKIQRVINARSSADQSATTRNDSAFRHLAQRLKTLRGRPSHLMRRTKSQTRFLAALVSAVALTWATGLPTALAQPAEDEIEMEGDTPPPDEGEIEMEGDTPPEKDLNADLAATTEDATKIDTTTREVKPVSWKDIVVVMRKPFLKLGRTDLMPFVGTTMNDNMIRHVSAGAQINYYLTDVLAIGVEGQFFAKNFREPFDLVGRQARRLPTVNKYNFAGALNFHYVPVYGKFAVLDKHLIHWETYFTVGVGVTQSEIIPRDPRYDAFTNILITPNLGASMRFFLFKWLTVNLGIRDYMFVDQFEPANRSDTNLASADDAKAKAEGKFINNVMFQLGVSFWIPPTFEYTTFR